MKTKEELNAIKKEVEALNRKLAELTDEELTQVTGGLIPVPYFGVGLKPGFIGLARPSEVAEAIPGLMSDKTHPGMVLASEKVEGENQGDNVAVNPILPAFP